MALTAAGPAWRKSVTCVGEITPAALAGAVTNWLGSPGAASYNLRLTSQFGSRVHSRI
jgi:hypothetical protein